MGLIVYLSMFLTRQRREGDLIRSRWYLAFRRQLSLCPVPISETPSTLGRDEMGDRTDCLFSKFPDQAEAVAGGCHCWEDVVPGSIYTIYALPLAELT